MLDRIVQFIRKQVADTANPVASAIAQRSSEEILERLGPVAREMSPAEARGYVRARGRRVVNLHTRLVAIELGHMTQATLDQVRSRALKQAVHEVVRKVLSKPSVRVDRRAA